MYHASYIAITLICGVCLSALLPSSYAVLLGVIFITGFSVYAVKKSGIKMLPLLIICFILAFFSYPFKEYYAANKNISGSIYAMGHILEKKVTDGSAVYTVNILKTKRENTASSPISSSKFKVYVYTDDTSCNLGSIIYFRGKFSKVLGPMNFGDFDNYRYYKSIGIDAFCYNPDIYYRSENGKLPLITRIKTASASILNNKTGTENGSFISAILLGDRSYFSEDLKESIRLAGVSHVTAVSGMHVSILIGVLLSISNLFSKRRKIKALFVILFLIFYAALTGFSPSIVRASVMNCACLFGIIKSRRTYPLHTLLLLASFMLIINPYLLYNPSFMLSFISTSALCLFMPLLNSGRGGLLRSVIYMTLIANLATLPYILWNFGMYSWIGLFVNLIIVPLVPYVFILGGLTIIFGLIPVIGDVISAVTSLITSGVMAPIKIISTLDFGQVLYKLRNPFIIALYIIVILYIYLIISKSAYRPKGYVFISAIILFSALGIYTEYTQNHVFKVTYLYVGQGDSTLISTPQGKNFLIDTGSNSTSKTSKCLSALQNLGIKHLDGILISHIDSDHMGAIDNITQNISVGKIYVHSLAFEEMSEHVNSSNLSKLTQGDTITLDGATIEILYPPAGLKVKNDNEASIVALVTYKNRRFLFPGDIPANVEKLLQAPPCDVLKVAHHGSSSSTSEEFLNMVSPKIAVISAGINNSYSHPASTVSYRLKNHNIKTYTTSLCGATAVSVTPNGKLYTLTVK